MYAVDILTAFDSDFTTRIRAGEGSSSVSDGSLALKNSEKKIVSDSLWVTLYFASGDADYI